MSADDTDTDKVSKGISLSHKNKVNKVSPKADNKMAKKDKASESIKKEFKHQMDLTKNIGQEEEPKAKPAPVTSKQAVKP